MKLIKWYLRHSLIHMAGLFPILLVLDFGMGVQIYRDGGPLVALLFVSALVFYAVVYARYVHKD